MASWAFPTQGVQDGSARGSLADTRRTPFVLFSPGLEWVPLCQVPGQSLESPIFGTCTHRGSVSP